MRGTVIRVNGAAIPASLFASELFGHEKGANLQISAEGLAFDPESRFFCPLNPALVQLLTDVLASFETVGVPVGI
ncbi:MAG: sigma 54-interacting transcriptional regulator [Candidatus Sulfotelmatobacter sp.]